LGGVGIEGGAGADGEGGIEKADGVLARGKVEEAEGAGVIDGLVADQGEGAGAGEFGEDGDAGGAFGAAARFEDAGGERGAGGVANVAGNDAEFDEAEVERGVRKADLEGGGEVVGLRDFESVIAGRDARGVEAAFAGGFEFGDEFALALLAELDGGGGDGEAGGVFDEAARDILRGREEAETAGVRGALLGN
jgi:hypothetical protein